jgi:hypothetical protein
MKKCGYEDLIDEYLLEKLKPDEQTDFEEHYFICRSCFEKMSERDELIKVLKNEGLFKVRTEPVLEDAREVSRPKWALGFLTPRRLAAVGAAAAVILAAVWLLIPRGGSVSPPLVLSGDDAVRGGAVAVLSPVAEIAEVPDALEWKTAGEDIEYRVSLSGKSPLMKAATLETRIVLPENVKAGLKPGVTYVWQVQAFKADGTLVAVSERVKFTIRPKS